MLAAVGIILLGLGFYAIVRPIVQYLQDPKGFRKYPTQNLLSGFTDLAYAWEVGREHPVFHTRRLHDALMKNGVMRVGPNWLSFGSSRAVRDIYGYTSPCLKAPIYDNLQENGQHLANMTDKTVHSDRRRIVAAAYAPKNIELWEPRITVTTSALVKQMDALCTAPLQPGALPAKEDLNFDGNFWGMLYGFEGTAKIGMSKDPGFIEKGSDVYEIEHADGRTEKINTVECLHSGHRATSKLIWDTKNFPMLKKISGKISPWYAESWRLGNNWQVFLRNLVKERIERYENGEKLEDLFQPMIEDKKTGAEPSITTRDRTAEMDQMFNGGIDGAGISMVNTLWYLVKNPHTIQRLRAELDAALSPDDVVAPWSKVKNLPYLRACVDEALRLSPSVATDLIRKTPSDTEYKVDNVVVPPGTLVSVSAFTAHRDPDVFPDPEAFKPERWLAKGDESVKKMLEVYISFTMGSRICMGKNVTLLLQLLYIATLVHRYEFALESPEWEMQRIEYFNLWPVKLPLKVWKREPRTAPEALSV